MDSTSVDYSKLQYVLYVSMNSEPCQRAIKLVPENSRIHVQDYTLLPSKPQFLQAVPHLVRLADEQHFKGTQALIELQRYVKILEKHFVLSVDPNYLHPAYIKYPISNNTASFNNLNTYNTLSQPQQPMAQFQAPPPPPQQQSMAQYQPPQFQAPPPQQPMAQAPSQPSQFQAPPPPQNNHELPMPPPQFSQIPQRKKAPTLLPMPPPQQDPNAPLPFNPLASSDPSANQPVVTQPVVTQSPPQMQPNGPFPQPVVPQPVANQPPQMQPNGPSTFLQPPQMQPNGASTNGPTNSPSNFIQPQALAPHPQPLFNPLAPSNIPSRTIQIIPTQVPSDNDNITS